MSITSLEFVSDRTFDKNPNIKFSQRTFYGPDSARALSYAERLNDLWPLVLSEFHITHPPIVRFASLKTFGFFGVCYGQGMDTPSLIMMDIKPEKNEDFDTFLQDLCHEMVHAEQWSRGDLTKNEDGDYFWKGQLLDGTTASLSALTQEEYRELPWEAEAYAREVLAFESIVAQAHF